MNEDHLSAFEQEEYILGQQTPEMVRHLANCAQCRAAVSHIEDGLAAFRSAAVDWSEVCSSTHSWHMPSSTRFLPMMAMRWALAGVLPVILMVLALLAFHAPAPRSAPPQASVSDDALLEQVDDQVSVSVPSSMESLTHLVSAEDDRAGLVSPSRQSESRSKTLVESN
jgi:predicted anti-sigma-YlaC factor YlaD